MTACSFCGYEIEPGTGKKLIRKDGRIFDLCSSKCEKNWKLGRKALRLKWTKTYKDFQEKKNK